LEIYSRCSIGVAFYPNDGDNGEELMSAADSAMYAAKADPTTAVHFFTKSMHEAARLRVAYEREIYAALERNEFFLTFHPVVQLDDFSHIGAEVLLRWQHPQRGLVGPAEFISVAERTGQIAAIGDWVLEQTCSYAAQLSAKQLDPGFFAVNVSRVQLNTEFAAKVVDVLNKNGMPAESLVLEITESTLMDEIIELKSMLDYWRKERVRLSLDDFGTGFSSLGYLRSFNFNTIKIDKSFVNGLPDSRDSRSLVAAIIAIADNLGMDVIAEGVEIEEQRLCLLEMGCRYFQGHLHREPMIFDDYRDYLVKQSKQVRYNQDKLPQAPKRDITKLD
jgi:EAL domain-containing protein (putative c-di-GMP-specific phosphodiesterase class I)